MVLQISQPQLPTVPVSSILLGPAAPAGTSTAPPSTVSAAGPITDGGIDLVSQIKVPVSIAAAAAAAAAPSPLGGGGKKRRSGGGFSSTCKYSSPHQGIKRSQNRGSLISDRSLIFPVPKSYQMFIFSKMIQDIDLVILSSNSSSSSSQWC